MTQIVINIDDKTYKAFMELIAINLGRSNYKGIIGTCLDAIKRGKVLPKGHGDLVDVEEVKEYLDNIQQELDGWGETDSAIEIAKARMELDSVSTIINADKENKT